MCHRVSVRNCNDDMEGPAGCIWEWGNGELPRVDQITYQLLEVSFMRCAHDGGIHTSYENSPQIHGVEEVWDQKKKVIPGIYFEGVILTIHIITQTPTGKNMLRCLVRTRNVGGRVEFRCTPPSKKKRCEKACVDIIE